ncbi:hypothetical protein SAMN02744133_1223 [Thalassospira xiamenensis M-5 = DSM 17429]|nr:hypothetical protein SAMN02744133_1223 [Thalassospira xiamenensis M-5 = DSM 17429]
MTFRLNVKVVHEARLRLNNFDGGMKYMKSIIFKALVCANVVQLLALSYFIYIFSDPLLNGAFIVIDNEFVNGKDSVAYAAEIGRLDTISLLVAYLGLFLIVFTIGSIWYSHHDARSAAQSTASEQAAVVATRQVQDYIDNSLSDELSELLLEDPQILESAVRSGLRNESVFLEQIVKDILEESGHIPAAQSDDSIMKAFTNIDADEMEEGGDDDDR